MRLLLDTHTLLWWAHEPEKLSAIASASIEDGENVLIVSPVSAMEIATKNRRNRLEYHTSLAYRFVDDVQERGVELLPITGEHATRAGNLPQSHKDPWDRLLAAQAMSEGLTMLTVDRRMAEFGAETLW